MIRGVAVEVDQCCSTREQAAGLLAESLNETELEGVDHNLRYGAAILNSENFLKAKVSTRFLTSFSFNPPCFEVLSDSFQCTVQDKGTCVA